MANRDKLAGEILASELNWTEDALPTCARTGLTALAPIRLSFPVCRINVDSKEIADRILIHKNVHHFNICDESFADAVAGEFYPTNLEHNVMIFAPIPKNLAMTEYRQASSSNGELPQTIRTYKLKDNLLSFNLSCDNRTSLTFCSINFMAYQQIQMPGTDRYESSLMNHSKEFRGADAEIILRYTWKYINSTPRENVGFIGFVPDDWDINTNNYKLPVTITCNVYGEEANCRVDSNYHL